MANESVEKKNTDMYASIHSIESTRTASSIRIRINSASVCRHLANKTIKDIKRCVCHSFGWTSTPADSRSIWPDLQKKIRKTKTETENVKLHKNNNNNRK